ncbi:MAG TPA: response regulator transcription factor [Hanamia sp.]
MNSLAILEDNTTVLSYLSEIIGGAFPDAEIFLFNNGEDACGILEEKKVDMVLFDIELPGMSGIECLYRLKGRHPDLKCMILTNFDDAENIFKAIKAGASSYILKNTSPEKIIDAIVDLDRGGSPMSSQIARKVLDAFQQQVNTHNVSFHSLSQREQEIIQHLAKGYRYKEIAQKLFISEDTVRTHIRNIYGKLQVNSRGEALKKTGLL